MAAADAETGAGARPTGGSAGRRLPALDWVVGLALAAVVLGPALRPGYLLRADLVTVPRPVITADTLGLGDRLPRAVPWDAVTAALAHLLPDAWLGQAIALVTLAAAGVGVARLAGGPQRWIALLLAVWNPFVAEQLAIGHLPHLAGYAAVPWVLAAARRVAEGAGGTWPLIGAAVAGSLTPGGGLLCLGAAIAGGWGRARSGPAARRLAPVVAGVGLLQAPWVTAGLLHPAWGATEPTAAFATRAETALGVVVDVLGLGGIWAGDLVPTSRTTPLALATTALLLGLAAAGLARSPGGSPVERGDDVRLAVLAGAGYLIALLPHLPGGGTALDQVGALPGGGLLRDGHRWLAWPAVALAVWGARGAARLGRYLAARVRLPAAATLVLVAAAVVSAAPDVAFGLSGRLQAHTFPDDWAQVRRILDGTPERVAGERLLVLPWQPFRRFTWSGPVAVLDPAPRAFPRPTLVDDALSVDGRRLAAEGIASRAIATALADDRLDRAELAAQGVGWVLVEHGTAGVLPQLTGRPSPRPVFSGPDLTLYRVDDPAPVPVGRARALTVLAAHLGYAGVGLTVTMRAFWCLFLRFRRATPHAR